MVLTGLELAKEMNIRILTPTS